MKASTVCFFVLACFITSSCVPFSQVPYFQEEESGNYDQAQKPDEYLVRKSDLLQIDLKSLDINTSTQEFFSGVAGNALPGGAAMGTGNAQLFFQSYLVNKEGMVDLPILGEMKVEGKTFDQIANEIELAIKDQVKFSKVTVRLTNYRVNVIGEVNIPGVQYVFDVDYTLFHALANAGDLTEFGNRKRVKLIRNVGGKTKTIWFDLTKPETLSSDYFYMLPGDLLYIEPLKAKNSRSNAQTISLGISVVSLAITILTLTTR